jgi:histidyl-tRNA synthetase
LASDVAKRVFRHGHGDLRQFQKFDVDWVGNPAHGATNAALLLPDLGS